MSNSSQRSTESEDGEIEREKKYRRSEHKRGHEYRLQNEIKRKKRDKTPEQTVSDDNNSNVEEEYEEVDDFDDIIDDYNEEGLDIKTPQQKASTSSRHKSYVSVSHRSEKSSKDSNRVTTESPNRQKDHRFRDKHRNRNKYSDNRSGRTEDGVKRKRRNEDNIQQEFSTTNKSRSSGKDKQTDRWMLLEDKNHPNETSRSKVTEESHRSHKDRHNRDVNSGREKSRKSNKITNEFAIKSPISSSNDIIKEIQRKSNALIEVQEVEMSDEEIISEEQNSPSDRSVSKVSEANSERSDITNSEDNERHIREDIVEQEMSLKKEMENELKNPRIVVEREVIYYTQTDDIPKDSEEIVEQISEDLPDYYPAIQGCRSVEEFQCINRIEEGTYGVVYRARDKRTEETVALKRLKMEKEKEGFPITSLREISTLLKAQHENIVTVKEIVVGSNMDKIYIVMEFVEHDLKSLMETMKQPFLLGEVKTLMQQLLRAVAHLHDNWILHRDLKTSNLLLSHRGILKVGDFGLAREYGSPLKAYTPIVVTLWYRAPELLLQARQYSYPIDIWSVGCIFGELLTMKPLFPGKSEIDQLNHIFKDLGTPNDTIWPDYSQLPLVKKVMFTEHKYNNLQNRFGQKLTKLGFDLMNRFLTYCPSRRITAEEALKHEFFNESPLPVDPSMFPTWPAKSELGVGHTRKAQSPKPPSGGKQFAKQLAGDDDEKLIADTHGFHMSLPVQGKASKGGGFNLKF